MIRGPPVSPLFPYTTLFRSDVAAGDLGRHHDRPLERRVAVLEVDYLRHRHAAGAQERVRPHFRRKADRKSTRLNSSHANISYAVFCLNKKNSLASSRTSKDL